MNKATVTIGGGNPMGTALSLLHEARKHYNQLPEEEKARLKEERERNDKERLRRAKILQNICPTCNTKSLTRGRKNKKNDYKRDWLCHICEDNHSI